MKSLILIALSMVIVGLISCELNNLELDKGELNEIEIRSDVDCEVYYSESDFVGAVDTNSILKSFEENWQTTMDDGIHHLFSRSNLNTELIDAAKYILENPTKSNLNEFVSNNFSLTDSEIDNAIVISDIAGFIMTCENRLKSSDAVELRAVDHDCAVAIAATLFVTALGVGVSVGSGGWATGVSAWLISKAFATYSVIKDCT